ncbi:FMN-binding domain protein [Secundilactobacillus odoratitofui DSM 19909 = JCM 15043]|uniref:FMN-binding domain protein n=1 Tax=Secundilactobacillus odoratitofui DSM 19909 = JCM 15043 TaxID=1423776 RepID=A0A0R1LRU4_9LACO|nr:FMN-binding protein [Secundilactobacillus odoratitofui]KRK98507.1 FMN-binding domain protein [Secundilactobacillus odoratitofui DSM 19909 = JCM 15043]
MKKFIASVVSLIVVIALAIDGYFLFFKQKVTGSTSQADSASNTATSSSTTSSSSSSSNASGKYKDGTYTGKATATQWGDVQVQAVIKNGKLTTVNVLEYPNDNGHDKQINAQALPVYKSEAVKAQSSKISLVSGASETYKGFTGSLQNALTKAEV